MACVGISSAESVIAQVPFRYLNDIIDVSFMVVEEDIQIPLSMRDMLGNVPDLSIQCRHVS